MTERISDNMRAILGTATAWTGTITAWQAHVEWALKVGASLAAIVVSILTAYSILRKMRKEREEKQ